MKNDTKILVVDDTPASLEVITEILSSVGYMVATAISGERALGRLQTYIPDLILLDVQMPGMDGFETCSQIKNIPNIKNIPIVFITALSDIESVVRGFSLGAVDYISKPFQELELLIRVKTHVQLHQLTQTLEKRVEERTCELEKTLNQLQGSQLQLIQQEKMSALGNLVVGIAHEINNPIGCVGGNLKELERNLADLFVHLALYKQQTSAEEIKNHAQAIDLDYLLEDIPKMLASMTTSCDLMRNISTSLRSFARADQDIPTAFNLHEVLDSTLLILKHRLRGNDNRPDIEVIKHYDDLPDVQCFPSQLNQVFMNVLANAIDVFDEAAQQSSFADLEAKPQQITIQTAVLSEQTAVEIRISDNGNGMTEAVKMRIFDHLFTTKDMGRGTGLGLAIARQIVVEKHGGTIAVESELGQGTLFVISLPKYGLLTL
jgi:signal transduction histidine kinase